MKPGEAVNNRPLLLAAALSAVLGVFCFFLPATPRPPREERLSVPRCVGLLKDPSFAVFFGVSFLISLALSVYFSFTALFLEQHGKVSPDNIGPIMTIGQWVEVLFMVMLPWFLGRARDEVGSGRGGAVPGACDTGCLRLAGRWPC